MIAVDLSYQDPASPPGSRLRKYKAIGCLSLSQRNSLVAVQEVFDGVELVNAYSLCFLIRLGSFHAGIIPAAK